MKYYNDSYSCVQCHCHIDERVYKFSTKAFEFSLCLLCQEWYKEVRTADEIVKLYFSLKERGVYAILEKSNANKKIDIAVIDARVNIEIGNAQHNYNYQQTFADLKKTYYSLKNSFITLRIPNTLIKERLEETADYITDLLVGKKDKAPRVYS